jgi:uncharacterized Tic20 family protein
MQSGERKALEAMTGYSTGPLGDLPDPDDPDPAEPLTGAARGPFTPPSARDRRLAAGSGPRDRGHTAHDSRTAGHDRAAAGTHDPGFPAPTLVRDPRDPRDPRDLRDPGDLRDPRDPRDRQVPGDPDDLRVMFGPSGDDDRLWATVAYLGMIFFAFLPPLAIYLIKRKESRYLRFHAAQALNLWITTVLYSLSFVIIGGVLSLDTVTTGLSAAVSLIVAAGLALLIYAVLAAVAASRGDLYRIPSWICVPMVRCQPPEPA